MEKYDLVTIINYYNGNDTDPYTTDELENDALFMRLVMHQFHDKSMYNFASDTVKQSYRYVNQLIELFPDDIEFLKNAVTFYVESKRANPHNALKLIIKLNTLIKTKNDALSGLYISLLATTKFFELWIPGMYIDQSDMIEEMIEFYTNMYDEMAENKYIVVDYYVRDVLKSILGKNESDTEQLVLNNFKSYDQFKEFGICNFFINVIKSENEVLAEYVTFHRYLLDEYIKGLERLEKKWDLINRQNEEELFKTIFNEVHCYVEYDAIDCPLSEDELLAEVSRELGLLEKIKKYDIVCNYENNGHDIAGMLFDDSLNITIIKDGKKHINKVKEIFLKVLSYRTIEEYEEAVHDLKTDMVDCTTTKFKQKQYNADKPVENVRRKVPCKLTSLELNCKSKNI